MASFCAWTYFCVLLYFGPAGGPGYFLRRHEIGIPMRATPKYLDILEVHWVDSEAIVGWTERYELPAPLNTCVSVGILAYESSESIVLSVSYDPENDSFNPLFTIPKVAIKKRKVLCKTKLTKK